MKKVKLFEEFFKGGVANGMSAQDLADKHGISLEEIEAALAKGQKVEVEHTNDSKKAYEIAKDHIFEDPKYYDKLSTIEEKKITISWNDDDNSIVFSDGEITRVDYDGAFKYRDEWFETTDHEGPEDLIKDLEKRFKRDKFEWISESYISEGKVKVFIDKVVGNMVSGAFGPSTNYKMREEIKQKIEAVVKETMEKYDYIVESKESDKLAGEINKAIIKIDDSMSYKDFALAVGKILKEEYGSHNYEGFMKILHKDLGI